MKDCPVADFGVFYTTLTLLKLTSQTCLIITLSYIYLHISLYIPQSSAGYPDSADTDVDRAENNLFRWMGFLSDTTVMWSSDILVLIRLCDIHFTAVILASIIPSIHPFSVTYPAAKEGKQVVPLPSPVFQLLLGIPRHRRPDKIYNHLSSVFWVHPGSY